MKNVKRILERYVSRKADDSLTTLSPMLRECEMLDCQELITEQNWIIIKLLNEINNKLDNK